MPGDGEGINEARLFKAGSSRLHWWKARWFDQRSNVHAPKQLLGSPSEAIYMLKRRVISKTKRKSNGKVVIEMNFQ